MDPYYDTNADPYYDEGYSNPGQYFEDSKAQRGFKQQQPRGHQKQHYRGQNNVGKFSQDFIEIPQHSGRGNRGGHKADRGQKVHSRGGKGQYNDPKFSHKGQSNQSNQSNKSSKSRGKQQDNRGHQRGHDG